MRSVVLAVVAALLVLATFAAAHGGGADLYGATSAVKILTPSNFDDVVGKDAGVFVEFYAPWCGHCKSLAPEYDVAATAFKSSSDKAIIASVNCDEYRELGQRFGVTGFPTLKWFPAGSLEPEAYSGARTSQGIIDFVNGKAGTNAKVAVKASAVTELDPSNFDSIVLDSSKDVLVKFYAPWCGHCKKMVPDYESAAESLAGESGLVVAKVDADKHRALGERFGVTGFPTLKFFPKGDKSGEAYEGGRTGADFVSFFNKRSGSERVLGGGFLPSAGRVASLDALASKLAAAQTDEDKKAVVKEIEEAAKEEAASTSGNGKEFAKFYKLAATNIATGKTDYATKEVARLQRMLAGKVTPAARANLNKRINIAKSFITESA